MNIQNNITNQSLLNQKPDYGTQYLNPGLHRPIYKQPSCNIRDLIKEQQMKNRLMQFSNNLMSQMMSRLQSVFSSMMNYMMQMFQKMLGSFNPFGSSNMFGN